MANGFDYESPLNAFLSRSLPRIVGNIADRQARERTALRELEYREARDEAGRELTIEQNRLTREQNNAQFEAKQKLDNDRYLESVMQANRQERRVKDRENRDDDNSLLQSMADLDLTSLKSIGDTTLFKTNTGRDRYNALLGKKTREVAVTNAMMKSLGAMNLPPEAMQALKTVKDDKLLFRSTLSSTLNSYAKNSGLTDLQINDLKIKYNVLEKIATLEASAISQFGSESKEAKGLTSQRKRIELDIAKVIGGDTTGKGGNGGSGFSDIEKQSIQILSRKTGIPVEEFGDKNSRGIQWMIKNGFTKEFFQDEKSKVLKRVNDFKINKDTGKAISPFDYTNALIKFVGGASYMGTNFGDAISSLKPSGAAKEKQNTQQDTSSAIADSTFLNQTLYRDPANGDTFPAAALVGAGQQDTTTKAMIDSVAQSAGLVKVQSAPVNKKEAAKKRKEKKDKKKMPGYEKRYRRLVNAARTEKNTRELNKLEEQYPNLIQLNLRGN